MPCDIVFHETFRKAVQKLSKRYPDIRQDLQDAIAALIQNSEIGDVMIGTNGIRKLRVKNSNARKGKSGGYRLIYYPMTWKSSVGILTVYSKSDREDMTHKELAEFIREISNPSP